MMMQSIVDRNRGFVTGDASAMGQQHLALSLSSARSLPVRGRRGGGWSAWKELAWLADADDANEERMVASHLPPTRVPSRQHVSTDLSHTLYSDLNSSRSENARSSFVPQPKNAWAEQQPNFSQPVSRRKQEDPSIEYYSAEIAGSARPASRAAVLAPTAVSSFQGSARNGTMLEQVHAAQHLPELPSHRHPSPHYRAKVESNQIAMAQGTEDFLSASQGFLREYNRLARLGLAQGNLPAAEVNITQAMDLIQQGDFSSTEVAAVTYNLLGCLHRREGRLNEAVDYLHRSLDILALRQQRGEALLERDVDLADIHMNMSSAQSALNRHDTALMHVETAIALLSERLGISQGQLPQESPSSEQDSKDLRMLAIAHYNRGAEMRTLKQDSTQAFEDALHLANKFLPPGDKLRAVIKKAQRRGGGARGVHKGDVQGVGAPPGVTPLRLSMLAAPGSGESSGRQRQPHSDLSGAAMRERERVRQQSISDMSYGGASSMGSARTALSSQSELTPQGWHKLHGVHRGTFASSARRSAREHGAADDTIPSSAQATASVTSMQVQTGLVRGSPPEGGAALPRNVFQRKHAAQLAGRDAQQQHAAIDENDEVLGLAQEHDMFSLIRAVPEGHAVLAASRYVPKDDKAKGLFDYVRSLDVSLIKPPPAKCESGTQVEHEFIADSSHTVPAEDRQARGYSSRDIVEQTVEQLVAHRARQELRGHDDVGGRDAWGLMSGSVNGVGTGGRGVARSAGRSLDRTYRKHLERTRQAHARYNKVATVLQLAYRCHLARQTAIELQRNPRHLKAMLAKTLHAFATLLQSNVRCMLAKRNVAKEANRRIMTAQDRWREQRNRAAYVIQAWFCEVVGARLMARRHSGPRDAAICLQHAFRCHRARRRADTKKADSVERILLECHRIENACVVRIQSGMRCWHARRKMAAARTAYQQLRAHAGVKHLWRGAAASLSGPQLRVAIDQQSWAVVSLQQRVLSCLQHQAWLHRAADWLAEVQAGEARRIQSAWRYKIACRSAITAIQQHDLEQARCKVEEAVGMIQRAWLARGARERLIELRKTETSRIVKAAAVDMQRVVKGHIARNSVRNRLRREENQRLSQLRCQELALRLQLGMRCCWARRVFTERYWEARSRDASTKIQCAARVWLARNAFQMYVFEEVQRRKTSAVLAVQAFAFSNAVVRRRPLIRFWRERRAACAGVLAAVYKAHLVRLDMQAFALERKQVLCATTLQRVFRAHKGRDLARQRMHEKAGEYQHAAALRVQTAMRARWARVSVQRISVLHMEAVRLRQEAEAIRRLRACRIAQARIRSLLAREYVLRPERTQRRRQAALVISRCYRGHAGRRLAERRGHEIKVEASNLIKCAYRLHLARLLVKRTLEHDRLASLLTQEQRRQKAAAVIQHAYLMHVSRLILVDRAALMLSCHIRCAVARGAYATHLAASTLQSAARRLLCKLTISSEVARNTLVSVVRRTYMRNKCRRKVASRNLTAVALAALIRESYARKLAADTICARAATSCARRRHEQKLAACRYLEMSLQRTTLRQGWRMELACLRIQSVVRGHMDREWVRACASEMRQHRSMLSCLVKLQATWRGHSARRTVGEIKEVEERQEACMIVQACANRARDNAAYAQLLRTLLHTATAIILQRYWRGALARHHRKQLAKQRVLDCAAVQVQRLVRGHRGRLLTHDQNVHVAKSRAAVVVQAWFRGCLGRARAEAVRQRTEQERSATVVQAGWRGMTGRARSRELRVARVEQKQAVKIQATVRGHFGRMLIRELRLAFFQQKQALKLQASVRGHFGRVLKRQRELEVVLEQELRTQMAITIQSCYRQRLARAAHLQAVEDHETLEYIRLYCADMLQNNVRCFNARNRLRRRREAALLITSLGRGFQARRKARKRHQVLEKQPLYVTPHKLRPELYEVPPGTDLRRPKRKAPVRKFMAEATVSLVERQPSPIPWHVRQQQAIVDFQSKPQIKAFFSGLDRGVTGGGKQPSKPAAPTASKSVHSSPEKKLQPAAPEKLVRPVSAMPQPPPAAAAVAAARPASAHPALAGRLQPPGSGKRRVPPRFRQRKATGDSGAESASSSVKKSRDQRPRARGSNSERSSDDDMPPVLQSIPSGLMLPGPMPVHRSPPRAQYNKDDISPDPSSDEPRKKKNKDKKGKREQTASAPTKTASPPEVAKPPSDVDPKLEAAFNHCRLGKYREVESALKEGVAVDARHGPDNNTMLLVCAQNGQKRVAKLLLRNFADMNAQNDRGNTAMHLCYKFNYKELGEYLKTKGADDTIRNAKGQTCYEATK